MSALERQVGGDHYKGLAIQPAVYNTLNKIGFLPGMLSNEFHGITNLEEKA